MPLGSIAAPGAVAHFVDRHCPPFLETSARRSGRRAPPTSAATSSSDSAIGPERARSARRLRRERQLRRHRGAAGTAAGVFDVGAVDATRATAGNDCGSFRLGRFMRLSRSDTSGEELVGLACRARRTVCHSRSHARQRKLKLI